MRAMLGASRTAIGIVWLLMAIAILVAHFILPPRVEIRWETASEFQTAGFNVYRSEQRNGEYKRLNAELIPGESGAAEGGRYLFVDHDVEPETVYYYQLEDVELDNSTTRHPPITGRAAALGIWAMPLAAVCALVGLLLVATGRPRPELP